MRVGNKKKYSVLQLCNKVCTRLRHWKILMSLYYTIKRVGVKLSENCGFFEASNEKNAFDISVYSLSKNIGLYIDSEKNISWKPLK